MGFGGSIFQWHPELEIGFGYVPTSLYVIDLMNERGKGYQREVVRCVQQLRVGAADSLDATGGVARAGAA